MSELKTLERVADDLTEGGHDYLCVPPSGCICGRRRRTEKILTALREAADAARQEERAAERLRAVREAEKVLLPADRQGCIDSKVTAYRNEILRRIKGE